jgi:Holliday junction resolvase RusA-like endonuclease
MQALSLIIFGEPASKSNSRRMVRFGSMSRLIKSAKALSYSDAFKQQVASLGYEPFSGDVVVTMTIYYASRRPDLDESLILDLLQGVTYLNDRQVKEKHIFWGLDKENPRCEITVTQK